MPKLHNGGLGVCHSPLLLCGFEIFPNNEKLEVLGVDVYHYRPSTLSVSCYLYHRVAIKAKRHVLHECFTCSVPHHLHLLRVSGFAVTPQRGPHLSRSLVLHLSCT